MAVRKGYSFTQIRLHWIVAVLILFQFVFGESIGEAWEAYTDGTPVTMGILVWGHIIAGAAVLALTVWRLGLRQTRGVPDLPHSTPLLEKAGKWGHIALYAVMIGAPVSGMMAWFGGIEVMAEVHELFKPAVILLVVDHIAAAIYHQFVLKDGLLMRMKRPLD